ncbi:MAG: Z1 domain-containing protein, partial [Thermoplasmatales archaeon]
MSTVTGQTSNITKEEALITARTMMQIMHLNINEIVNNPAIPYEYHDFIRAELENDSNITLEPIHMIVQDKDEGWYQNSDRTSWYYWKQLRAYYLRIGWSAKSLISLDSTTDSILRQFRSPEFPSFDVKGLVLGYVQSGKTSNFAAIIAKAADCGYRLFIVLSGIDKGLRRQTQIRLERELMGYGARPGDLNHVPLPPQGRQWHKFTSTEVDGDFYPGNANQASLQGPEPVIMVVKKNGSVLRRLIEWLSKAPPNVLRTTSTLIIDDEADLASIDTRGSYQTEEEDLPDDYEPPSVINGLIRDLIMKFTRKVYVAYTATPFANILIPHDTFDRNLGNDLYPKDFIISLPKPEGYFGAEELFGLSSPDGEKSDSVLGVIKTVDEGDVNLLEVGQIPTSMENAMLGFVLAGAARAQRGEISKPATMLIHTSHKIESHTNVTSAVQQKFDEFKNT